ncbi:MAG: GAP family protein [Nocardioides sp.]
MTATLLQTVPMAVGVMLSPAALIEFILVLLSRRARTNGLVFLGGTLVGLVLVPLIASFVVDTTATQTSAAPSSARNWILLVLGALLLLLAVRNLRDHSAPTTPKVYDLIGNMGPWAVLALTPGVTVLNPKNIVLLISAGGVIGGAGLSTTETVVAAALFAIFTAAPYIAAVVYLVVGGAAATTRLEQGKAWLVAHNRAIMGWVFFALGLYLLLQGLQGLAA